MADPKQPSTRPCKSCGAPVYFAQWRKSGKWACVDASPDPNGRLVLSKRGASRNLHVELFDARVHGPERRRWTDHHSTCPEAEEWRNRAS